jgi:alkaline phosphatase
MHRLLVAAFATALLGASAQAQTIYPVDRAEILVGSRFDLKVEFPGLADPAKVALTLNGRPPAELLGKEPTFVEREDGRDMSALILRDAALQRPGTYLVRASDGAHTREVAWSVYETGRRRARNVILFIGDGMSPAHRVAARILPRALPRANPRASSQSMTCRTWRLWRPRAPIPSSPIQPIP